MEHDRDRMTERIHFLVRNRDAIARYLDAVLRAAPAAPDPAAPAPDPTSAADRDRVRGTFR